MVGKKSNLKPILIRGTHDFVKIKERWTAIKKYFMENNIDFLEINSVRGNILSKIMCLIYLLDYATLYRAILNKTDPFPVRSIEYVKSQL